MKAYRSSSLTPLILNLPLDRSAWSASCLSREKKPRHPLWLGGFQIRSGHFWRTKERPLS